MYKFSSNATRDTTFFLYGDEKKGIVQSASSFDKEDSNMIVGGWYKRFMDGSKANPWYIEHHFIYLGYGVMATRMGNGGVQYETPDDGHEWHLVE